jgi:hypothetical protein
MEIASFETSAFNRRQAERSSPSKRPFRHAILSIVPGANVVFLFGLACLVYLAQSVPSQIAGNIVTPNRLLVFVTVCLILITPYFKRKSVPTPIPSPPQSVKPTPAPIPQIDQQGLFSGSPDRPMFSQPRMDNAQPFHRYSSEFVSGLGPVPSRYDPGSASHAPGRSSMAYSPAPFVDDIQLTEKHEFTNILPEWARKFEELILSPLIIRKIVNNLEDSNRSLNEAFGRYSMRFSQSTTPGRAEAGVVYLGDRFLPAPLSQDQEIVNLWQRRQMIERLLEIPGFSSQYRPYVVDRITSWAHRGGLRFTYRYDQRKDEGGPTDSHILVHILFAFMDDQFGDSFQERFVTNSSIGTSSSGFHTFDFNTMFAGIANRTGHHSKVVWLESVTKQESDVRGMKKPLHFNVGTNQRTYGIGPGGGNLIEAVCLFFHLLKRLGPSSIWMHIPPENRIPIESIVGSYGQEHGGLSGGLLIPGLSSSKPALGALHDGGFSFRGN